MNNPRNVPGIRKQYIGHVTLGEKRAVREAGTARGGGWGGGVSTYSHKLACSMHRDRLTQTRSVHATMPVTS